MKKLLITGLIMMMMLPVMFAQTNVGINNPTPHASAALDISSTTQGMLVPRLTLAQRNLINVVGGQSMPAMGLLIYQTDNTPGFYSYNGSAWAAVSGGATATNYELNVAKTPAETQTTSVGSNLVLPDIITFPSANGSNATLSGGNTWDGASAKFTVGPNGAGLYLIDIQLISVNAYCAPMIDMNNTGNSGASFYGSGLTSNTFQASHRARGILQKTVFLNAGEFFNIRGASGSTVVGADLAVDGSTLIRITKLK